MRALLIAFALGALAIAVAVSSGGLILGIAAQSGHWSSFHIGLGPLTFLSFERLPHGTSTTFGSGLAVVAAGGGALNAFGAALLRRRG